MTPKDTHARRRLNPTGSSLERRLIAGFGSTALVLIVAAFSFAELSSVAASKRWVRHTIDVIASLHEVQTTLLDAESGQRGFLLTAEAGYLDSYRLAGDHARAQIRSLRELTADNREQQARLDTLEHDVEDRLTALAETLQRYQEETPSSAVEQIRTGRGQRAMEARAASSRTCSPRRSGSSTSGKPSTSATSRAPRVWSAAAAWAPSSSGS